MNLTLFDLDETLIPLDSDHAWGEFVIRLGWVDEAEFRRRNDAFYAQYKAGRLDIHAYIEFATEPLRARSVQQAEEAHVRFMQEVIEPNLRPAALDLVREHQRRGDWPAAGLVAIGAAAGGVVGGGVARRLPPVVLRVVVVAIGLVAVLALR